ncbi:hypothetical protein [Haladaptatus caseinilyticus]|uniref:hypothetical protein n=1 Tax=Haladaptatus caseinilyticus TaxID=2993314 RepID=UPI00224B5813|nr:hypothetical protein [Haladaptatus caseinilyticus]
MSHGLSLFDYVCSNTDKFALLFAFECLAGVLSIALFFWTEPGTATHVISLLNAVGAGALGAVTGVVLLKCYRT